MLLHYGYIILLLTTHFYKKALYNNTILLFKSDKQKAPKQMSVSVPMLKLCIAYPVNADLCQPQNLAPPAVYEAAPNLSVCRFLSAAL